MPCLTSYTGKSSASLQDNKIPLEKLHEALPSTEGGHHHTLVLAHKQFPTSAPGFTTTSKSLFQADLLSQGAQQLCWDQVSSAVPLLCKEVAPTDALQAFRKQLLT